jgi:HD-like signal output (HDOD) protein
MILADKELDKYFMHKSYEIIYHNQVMRPFEQILVAGKVCKPIEAAASQKNKEGIFDYIKRILDKGDVILPMKKDVAFQMLPVLESDDVSIQEIAIMSRTDPGIHAGLIKLANSVHYSGLFTDIKDIESAIVRIGTMNIKMFLINYINAALASNKELIFHKDISEAVEESIRVGCIAHVLADVLKFSGKKIVFSIGMIHRIGYIFLLAVLSDYLEGENLEPKDSENYKRLAEHNSINAGIALLMKWKFKPEFYMPVQFQDEPFKCKFQNEAKILKMSKILYNYFRIGDANAASAYLMKNRINLTKNQLDKIRDGADDFYLQTKMIFD